MSAPSTVPSRGDAGAGSDGGGAAVAAAAEGPVAQASCTTSGSYVGLYLKVKAGKGGGWVDACDTPGLSPPRLVRAAGLVAFCAGRESGGGKVELCRGKY